MRCRFLIYLVLGILVIPLAIAKDINIESFSTVDYNLGDRIGLSGSVLVDENIYARLNINLVCDNNNILVYSKPDFFEADETYDFLDDVYVVEDMVGDCYFWIKLLNDDAGLIDQKTSEKIHVKKELDIDVEIDTLNKNPGATVEIDGNVKKSNGIELEKGNLSIIIDNVRYIGKVIEGKFSYDLTLEDDIKSGKHIIYIFVEDGKGNEGKEEFEIVVNAIPTEIKIETNSKTFKPKDILELKVKVYDQAEDLISKGVNVDLYNSDNFLEYNVNKKTNEEIEFRLPDFALPGSWKIKAVSGELKIEKEIYIEEVIDKEIKLEGEIVIVRNTGNVNFYEELEINLISDGKEYNIIKKTSLKPNQTMIIDLTKEVPAGDYNVNIAGGTITGSVVLEKGVIISKGTKWVGYGAMIFVLVFLMFMVFNKGKSRVVNRREKARIEGRKRLEELKKIPKKSKIEKGPTKEDVDYLIKKVQQDEDKKDRDSGLFNMFD